MAYDSTHVLTSVSMCPKKLVEIVYDGVMSNDSK